MIYTPFRPLSTNNTFTQINTREQLFEALCTGTVNVQWGSNAGVRQFAGRVHSISREDGSGFRFCVEICYGYRDGKPVLSNEYCGFQ